jgi:hypothetical protein
MGWRFKIGPLNITKNGISSVSFGSRGLRVNINKYGRRDSREAGPGHDNRVSAGTARATHPAACPPAHRCKRHVAGPPRTVAHLGQALPIRLPK